MLIVKKMFMPTDLTNKINTYGLWAMTKRKQLLNDFCYAVIVTNLEYDLLVY